MPYESIDHLQNIFADQFFSHSSSKKKAAGRCLGTFVEIIVYYLLKSWKLETSMAIERPLSEFGNDEIKHNVEYTLHGSDLLLNGSYSDILPPVTARKIINRYPDIFCHATIKSKNLVESNGIIHHACTLADSDTDFINAYADTQNQNFELHRLQKMPFAMLECKRVGVEEGCRKGPQTIEKAKQGAYVARSVSCLQKIRGANGSLKGILRKPDEKILFDDYHQLISRVIHSNDKSLLSRFVLTIGVVSNHGNWFTAGNQNKEIKVLAQSYDWLIFLTDRGLSHFIQELLLDSRPNNAIRNAFLASYAPERPKNFFTKVSMEVEADKALCHYFADQASEIHTWFNIISPGESSLAMLQNQLQSLREKNWREIYQ